MRLRFVQGYILGEALMLVRTGMGQKDIKEHFARPPSVFHLQVYVLQRAQPRAGDVFRLGFQRRKAGEPGLGQFLIHAEESKRGSGT